MRYIEGIDYDAWWNGLDLPTRRDLEAARRLEALTRRHAEVRDYTVAVIWTDTGPSQGVDGDDGNVTYAMIHPRQGAGFQCQAEAELYAIQAEDEAIGNGLEDVVVHITTRVRWKDGDRLRLGTTRGLDVSDAELADPVKVKTMIEAFRQRLVAGG